MEGEWDGKKVQSAPGVTKTPNSTAAVIPCRKCLKVRFGMSRLLFGDAQSGTGIQSTADLVHESPCGA